MNDCFKHRPRDTQWIGVEFFVGYSCTDLPEVDELVITGLRQVGFVFSHEYEIRAFVEEARRNGCKKPGCDRAIEYEFDVRFHVSDKYGFGIGFGSGTGTLGWTRPSRQYIETFTTRCICCDQEKAGSLASAQRAAIRRASIQIRQRDEIGLPAVMALLAVAGSIGLSVANVNTVPAQGFLGVTCVLAAVSLLVISGRALLGRKLRKSRRHEDRISKQ